MPINSRIAILLIVSLFLLFIPISLYAATYYVDGVSGNDLWGGSRESPFATIQAAMDSTSSSGDEIRVAQGTYTGISAVDPDGSGETYYQVVFIRNKSLTLRGGYNTSDWETSDPETNITTIDAGENGRCITIRGSSSETVTVDGFTITGGDYSDLGNADGVSWSECARTSSDCGGGIYAYLVVLNLMNCVVTDNTASSTSYSSDGGGIYLLQTTSGTQIDNVKVSDNDSVQSSSNGGGLQIYGCNSVAISNSTFTNNHSTEWGGGIGIWWPNETITIEDTNFSGNTCFSKGGAIGASLDSGETGLYVNRANFKKNESNLGVCIYIQKVGSPPIYPLLNNLILSGNTPYASGNDNSLISIIGFGDINVLMAHITATDNAAATFLYADDPDSGETTSVTVNNTIIDSFTNAFAGDDNSAGAIVFNYNNTLFNNVTNLEVAVSGSPTFNAGESIFADPLLDATYHLQAGSPAINAGMDAGVTTDIDGDARPKGSGYDIGADEFYANTLSGIIMMLLN